MGTNMIAVQAGYTQTIAAEDFMGLAQCRTAPVA